MNFPISDYNLDELGTDFVNLVHRNLGPGLMGSTERPVKRARR